MATRTNKRTGEVQQQDASGNWVTITPPSMPRIQTRGPDQLMPSRIKKAQNDAAASDFAPGKAQADNTIAQAQAANALAIAQAQRDKAVADARAAEIAAQTDANGGRKLDPAIRKAAIDGYNNSVGLLSTVDDLTKKFNAGPGATHGPMGLSDYLPLTINERFDTAADKSRGLVGSTLGFTGGQLNTGQESKMNIGPFLPHSGDRDTVATDKIGYLRDLGNQGRTKAIQTLGGIPDENGNIQPVPPQQNVDQLPENPNLKFSGGSKTRSQIDPVMQHVGNRVGAMIAGGQPDDKIIKFLQDNGVDPAQTNVLPILRDRTNPNSDVSKWLKYRGNVGKPYPIGPEFYTKQVEMTAPRQVFNAAAATNLGGAMVAAPVAAANAIVGDRLGSITNDPTSAQGMALLRQNHPLSSLVGDVAGQSSLEALAGRIPGMHGLLASRLGRRGADFGYGVYSGTGDSSGDDPASGGIIGGAMNMGGGMIGRGLFRGTGKAATGVRDPQVNYLASQGIPLTPGRIGRGTESIFGKGEGGIEERLMGLPGFDAVIGAARRRGDEAFNSAAFRQTGGSGATGGAGLAEVNGLKNQAYGFLNGTDIPLDAHFAGRNAAVRAGIPDLPGFGDEVGKSLNQIDKVSSNGRIAGDNWHSALSDIRSDRSTIVGKPFAGHAVKSMKEVEDNLLNLAARQGPAGTVDNLNAANALNAKVQTLASALDNGPTQKAGQLFSPGRLDDASRVNTRKFGGRLASLTGQNRPFYELSQAGLDVMPNLTPDSGSAGRLALLGTLAAGGVGGIGAGIGAYSNENDRGAGAQTGGELGSGGYLGALTLAGLLYSKSGQKVLQKALIGKRPDRITRLGDLLINNDAIGGKIGSGVARQYIRTLNDLSQ